MNTTRLTFNASNKGYSLFYKGILIGGVHNNHTTRKKQFSERARQEIRAIKRNKGQQTHVEAIERIDNLSLECLDGEA